jgi:hypothetical protein
MATHSFNNFLRSLQDAVGRAQESAATQHRAMVEQMVESGQDREPRAQYWNIRIPAAGTGDGRDTTVVLPLLSLRPLIMPQVTGFSMEVAVEVETRSERYPSGLQKMNLVIPRNSRDFKREPRRLRVTLAGPQPGAGQVLIDGTLLKRLEDGWEPRSAAPAGVRSRFQRFLEFIRRGVPSRRGAMRLELSEEDARRWKDIHPKRPG